MGKREENATEVLRKLWELPISTPKPTKKPTKKKVRRK